MAFTPSQHTLRSGAVVLNHPCSVCGVWGGAGDWPDGMPFEQSTWWCREHTPAEHRGPGVVRPAAVSDGPWLCDAISDLLGVAA